jgi:hypothetical protein
MVPGSTWNGLDHWRVADKQWGLTMQDDLDDAALFLVKKGLRIKINLHCLVGVTVVTPHFPALCAKITFINVQLPVQV